MEIKTAPASVRYYRNGVLFYTSTLPPAWPLIVFAKITSVGAVVSNAVVAANFPPTQPPTASAGGPYGGHTGELT